MNTATATAYQRSFTGWFMPSEMRKSRRIGLSTGIGTHIQEKYIVSKIAFC